MSPATSLSAAFAVGLALIGSAAISTPAATAGKAVHSCELRMVPHRGGTRITARLAADTNALSGMYRLSVTGRGIDIDQSGDFALWPGEAADLGEIELSASPGALKGTLTLTLDGKRLSCPVVSAPVTL